MIFELDHPSIATALKEYMESRGIINGKDFTFVMKTSRKGLKTSRAVITVMDTKVAPMVSEPVVEAVVAPQVEVEQEEEEVTLKPDLAEKEETEMEAKATPFKKLFA